MSHHRRQCRQRAVGSRRKVVAPIEEALGVHLQGALHAAGQQRDGTRAGAPATIETVAALTPRGVAIRGDFTVVGEARERRAGALETRDSEGRTRRLLRDVEATSPLGLLRTELLNAQRLLSLRPRTPCDRTTCCGD